MGVLVSNSTNCARAKAGGGVCEQGEGRKWGKSRFDETGKTLSFIFPLTLTISTPVESFHFGSIQLIGNGTCRFYKCLRCTTTRANSHHRTSPRQTSIRSGGSSRLPPHVRRRVGGHLLQSSGARADQVLARWVAPWSAALPASVAAAERTGMAVVPCHRASCGACLARPGRGAAGRRACRPRASATHCRPHVTLCPRRARPGGVCDGILACNRLACFTTRRDIIIKRGIIVSLRNRRE